MLLSNLTGRKFFGDWVCFVENLSWGERVGLGGIGQNWLLDVLLLVCYPFWGFQILNRNKNWVFVLFVIFLGVIVAVRENLADDGTKLREIRTWRKWGF